MKKFVLLQDIENGNRFFTMNSHRDPTKMADGSTAYRIIGYADTVKDAQLQLYGCVFPSTKDCGR